MSLYDSVKFKANCWKCGKELSDFQTKDGECLMKLITPKEIGLGTFYSMCLDQKCNAWNQFDVIPKEIEVVFNEKESKLKS